MSEEQTQEATNQFSHDGAITSIKDDRLNRSGMAENIAKMLLNNTGKESFVFGIDGEWGSGKTSFLYMIKSCIEERSIRIDKYPLIEIVKNHYKKYKVFTIVSIIISILSCFPIVWNCKDPIYNFFAIYFYLPFFLLLLSHFVLYWVKKEITLKGRGNRFPVIIDFQPWIYQDNNTRIIEYFNTITAKIKKTDKYFYNKIKRETKNYLQSIFTDAELSIKIPGFEYKKKLSLKEPALYYKDKLSLHFENSNYKFIIVIDDLDRLEEEDIRNTFRFLKSAVDLPNTIYILAYSSRKIQEAFGEQENYIEKIVQLTFVLPKPDKIIFRDLIKNQLAILFPFFNQIKDEGDAGLNILWEKIFINYFQTIRIINKFRNRAFTDLTIVGKENIDEIDFFLIEVIKHFEFEYYRLLSISKERFFSNSDNNIDKMIRIFQDGPTNAFITKSINEIIPTEHQLIVTQIIHQLFSLNREIGSKKTNGDLAKENRIVSEKCYDNYFLLNEPSEYHLKKDIIDLFSNIENKKIFDQIFSKLINNRNSILALEEIRSFVKEQNDNNTKLLIKNISYFGKHNIKPEEINKQIFSNIRDIILELLSDIHSFNNSSFILMLEFIFNETEDLFIITSILKEVDQSNRDKSKYFSDIARAEAWITVVNYKKNIFNNISNKSTEDFFYNTFDPVSILGFWLKLNNDKKDIEKYIEKFLINDKNIVYFIELFIKDIPDIGKYYPTIKLSEKIKSIDITQLSIEEKSIIGAYSKRFGLNLNIQ